MDIEAQDVNCISFVFAKLGIIEEERFVEPGLASQLIDPYFRRVPLPELAVVFAFIAANNMVYHMGLIDPEDCSRILHRPMYKAPAVRDSIRSVLIGRKGCETVFLGLNEESSFLKVPG